MKNYILLFLLILPCLSFAQSDTMSYDSEKIYTVVETMPVAPGCEDSEEDFECTTAYMIKFVQEEFVLSEKTLERLDFSGTAYISFVINEEGETERVQVERSVGNSLEDPNRKQKKVIREIDQTAVETVSKMKFSKPGFQKGEPVKIQFILPVRVGGGE